MKARKINRQVRGLQKAYSLDTLSAKHFATTASTNTLLLHGNDGVNSITPKAYTIVSADTQTHGHGRSGRPWSSSKGTGVYMSISLPPLTTNTTPATQTRFMGQLNIITGYKLCDNLRSMGIPAYLKWPNDIIVNNRKIGGILLEATYQNTTPTRLVVGVGLNINQTNKQMAHLPQSTSIRMHTGRKHNMYNAYTLVAASIIEAYIEAYTEAYIEAYTEAYIEAYTEVEEGNHNTATTSTNMAQIWGDYSQNLGKEIAFHTLEGNQQGKVAVTEQGITDDGYIITTNTNGTNRIYTYGEVGYSNINQPPT